MKESMSVQVAVFSNNIKTPEVTPEVTDRVGTKFRDQVLNPLIDDSLIEMTIPEKPQSSKQKYRLTDKGKALLASSGKDGLNG